MGMLLIFMLLAYDKKRTGIQRITEKIVLICAENKRSVESMDFYGPCSNIEVFATPTVGIHIDFLFFCFSFRLLLLYKL